MIEFPVDVPGPDREINADAAAAAAAVSSVALGGLLNLPRFALLFAFGVVVLVGLPSRPLFFVDIYYNMFYFKILKNENNIPIYVLNAEPP